MDAHIGPAGSMALCIISGNHLMTVQLERLPVSKVGLVYGFHCCLAKRVSVMAGAAQHPRSAAASGQLPGHDDSGALPASLQPHHGPPRHRILQQDSDQVMSAIRRKIPSVGKAAARIENAWY